MSLKLVALASLIEYVFVKPYLIPNQDNTDFIGYCLCMAFLAFFGQIFTNRLTAAQWEKTKWSGIYSGVLGYAWLLLGVKHENRQIHHLLVAKLAILGGVLVGAYTQKGKKDKYHGGGRLWVSPLFTSAVDFDDTNWLFRQAGGGSGPRVRTSKDIDSVRFIKPGQSGCCGMQNGFPVDN